MRSAIVLLTAGLSATSIGCNCKGQGEKPSSDGSLVVRASDGVIKIDGEVPTGFPLSIPPGSKPTAAVAREAAGTKRQIVRLESDIGVVQAIEFYDRDLRRRGFEIRRIEEEEEGISTSILRGSAGGDEIDVAIKRRQDGGPGSVVRVTWTRADSHP